MNFKKGDKVKRICSFDTWNAAGFSNNQIVTVNRDTKNDDIIFVESHATWMSSYFKLVEDSDEVKLSEIRKVIFNAASVAHLKGYEQEILPCTDLTWQLLKIVRDNNLLGELK